MEGSSKPHISTLVSHLHVLNRVSLMRGSIEYFIRMRGRARQLPQPLESRSSFSGIPALAWRWFREVFRGSYEPIISNRTLPWARSSGMILLLLSPRFRVARFTVFLCIVLLPSLLILPLTPRFLPIFFLFLLLRIHDAPTCLRVCTALHGPVRERRNLLRLA